MRDGARVMRLEGSNDFEGLRQDSDLAMVVGNEEILRA